MVQIYSKKLKKPPNLSASYAKAPFFVTKYAFSRIFLSFFPFSLKET